MFLQTQTITKYGFVVFSILCSQTALCQLLLQPAKGVQFGVATDAEPADSKDGFEQFARAVADYQIQKTDSGTHLVMQKQPLLHWSNPARNGERGAVFCGRIRISRSLLELASRTPTMGRIAANTPFIFSGMTPSKQQIAIE
jgi:hypothetical protein